ncbi:E3 ubiquitin-protein ligase RHF2A-like, partial [Hibiscus syriacus]
MEETQKLDSRMTSAAAFVEGGIQDASDDSCSICLDEFCSSDPSTVTNCKHEFHLQCILEWCQRSSQCPMCWRAINLKDSASQEMLQAVERERIVRVTAPRNTAIFHHPTLGDFELQHLPVGVNDPELEERIIQHFAAAMGRTHRTSRREGQRRSSTNGRSHLLVFSHPTAQQSGSGSSTQTQIARESEAPAVTVARPSSPLPSREEMPPFPSGQNTSASGTTASPVNRRAFSFNNRSTSGDNSFTNTEGAGPLEFQSFSESLKSKLNAVSLRYKESISKSTRGLKERLFSRSSSMSDIGNEVLREVSAGIASVSRMMERLEINGNNRENQASASRHSAESSVTEQGNQHNTGRNTDL